ncbi:MAG: PP2C family protein-serine/threonine phosphatase [Acidimicrobiia bacterium]
MPSSEIEAPGLLTSIDPALERRLSLIGQTIRWLAVIYAVLVLWNAAFDWFDLPDGPLTVRDIPLSGAIALVALSFAALLGGDNLRSVRGSVSLRRAGLVISWISAAFGVFVMLTFIFDLMWPWWESVNEMSAFAVGLNMFMLGVAVPLSVSRIEVRVIAGQVATLLVFSLTAVIFVGYALGTPSVGRLFLRPEISFQAALGALLVALGVILIRPGSGLLSIAASPSRGGALIRRLGPVVLFAPALLLFLVEELPTASRVDGLAVVAVTLGFLLLVLLGVLARLVDVTALEASAAQARAVRAQEGLDQEAPVVARLAENLHLVEVADLEGWEVATRFRLGEGSVGGDASVVRLLPHGRVGVVVVDVTGHGAVPALRAIRTRDLLIHALALGHSPADVLGSIRLSLGDDALASAAVLCLEPESGALAFAAAGHPPMIHTATQTADLLGPTGPLLFLDPDAEYEQLELELSVGDTIVLFSDGVADVQVISGGRTEPEQLADALLAEGGVASRTADLVLGFGEGHPSDDQSVVVLRRTL